MYYAAEAVMDMNRYSPGQTGDEGICNTNYERRGANNIISPPSSPSCLYGSMPLSDLNNKEEEGGTGEETSLTLFHRPGTAAARRQQQQQQRGSRVLNIDDAIEKLGTGYFQHRIFVMAGLAFAAEAMEFIILIFLSQTLKKHWGLTDVQAANIARAGFLGAVCGSLLLGNLADRVYGRRPITVLVSALIGIFGMLTATVDTYEWILFSRFMVGLGVGGLTVIFDTLAEFLPGGDRGRWLLYIQFFWTGGFLVVPSICLLPGYEQNWRLIVFVCAVPCVTSTIMLMWLLPESPRWLLTRGMRCKAMQILRQAAVLNGKDPADLYPVGTFLYCEEPNHGSSLASRQWVKLSAILFSTYFGLAFVLHGSIALTNSVPPEWLQLVPNPETQSTASFIANAPGIIVHAISGFMGVLLALLVVDRWGRIATQVIMYSCGGAFCLILSDVASSKTPGPPMVLVLMACMMRLFLFSGMCTAWISAAEMLSTEMRATGHACASAIGRVGSFLCAYTITSNLLSIEMIGGLLFVVSLGTALSASLLPETGGIELGMAQFPSALSVSGSQEPQLPGKKHMAQQIRYNDLYDV